MLSRLCILRRVMRPLPFDRSSKGPITSRSCIYRGPLYVMPRPISYIFHLESSFYRRNGRLSTFVGYCHGHKDNADMHTCIYVLLLWSVAFAKLA